MRRNVFLLIVYFFWSIFVGHAQEIELLKLVSKDSIQISQRESPVLNNRNILVGKRWFAEDSNFRTRTKQFIQFYGNNNIIELECTEEIIVCESAKKMISYKSWERNSCSDISDSIQIIIFNLEGVIIGESELLKGAYIAELIVADNGSMLLGASSANNKYDLIKLNNSGVKKWETVLDLSNVQYHFKSIQLSGEGDWVFIDFPTEKTKKQKQGGMKVINRMHKGYVLNDNGEIVAEEKKDKPMSYLAYHNNSILTYVDRPNKHCIYSLENKITRRNCFDSLKRFGESYNTPIVDQYFLVSSLTNKRVFDFYSIDTGKLVLLKRIEIKDDADSGFTSFNYNPIKKEFYGIKGDKVVYTFS